MYLTEFSSTPLAISRHGTPPFVSARSVLEPLAGEEVKVNDDLKVKVKVKSEKPDILQLCNIVALEVVNLGMAFS